MTVYAWWFMFIGWLIHPLDTTVLGCIPAYLPTRKIIDAFSYLLPRCPFERQERAKMLQKFKQHIDGISGPLEQHFTQHHLFHWKSSNLNLLRDDEEIGSKLNEKKSPLLQNLIKLYFCFNMNLQLIMGSSKKSPNKNLHGFPGCPLRSRSSSTTDDCSVGKAAAVKKMPAFWREKMPRIEVLEMLRKDFERAGGFMMLFFLGEKWDESLLKLLEHVGKNAWMTYEIYGNMTTRLDWILVKWTLWDAIPTSVFSNSKVGLGIASDWDDWDPVIFDWNLSTS